MASKASTAALAPTAGTIAVELVEGAEPRRKCDAFWLASESIDPRRVLFVLERVNLTFVDVCRSLEEIRQMGSRVVSVDPRMNAGGEIPYWRPRVLPQWTAELREGISAGKGGTERWLARKLLELADRAGYWHAFYLDHGVLVVQQFTELSTETAVKRIAIDRVGGIEIGKMRSQSFERASTAFHFQHEVALVWHRNVEPCLRDGRTRTRTLVETGYVYDFLKKTLADEGSALRRRFNQSAVSIVAAVFDNYPHVNGHFCSDDLESFYLCILALARRYPRLGLIVKSKKPGVLGRLPSIATELGTLTSAGRCVVLDEALSSVIPAALASELAFGFPTSTAACEAALAGCRTLMYDPARSSDHPWIGPELGIILHDLSAFGQAAEAAIRDVLAGHRGMPRERLLELDPFLDGRSPDRAAQFICAFLNARRAGRSKVESIEAAMQCCAEYAFGLESTTD